MEDNADIFEGQQPEDSNTEAAAMPVQLHASLTTLGISGKIFVLSMQRSGTTSVGDFLQQFGLKRAGYPLSNARSWDRLWWDANYDAIINDPEFVAHEVFEDSPWWMPDFFKVVFHKIPGSRFILLTRDPDSWFSSLIRHSQGMNPGCADIHAKAYGREDDLSWLARNVSGFNVSSPKCLSLYDQATHYQRCYLRHTRNVETFFAKSAPEALFSGALSDPDIWRRIGCWLGLPVRDDVSYDIHAHKSAAPLSVKDLAVVPAKTSTAEVSDSGFSEREQHRLIACFCEGWSLLRDMPEFARAIGLQPLQETGLLESELIETFIAATRQLMPNMPPDWFYTTLQWGFRNQFVPSVYTAEYIRQHLTGSAYPRVLFDETFKSFPNSAVQHASFARQCEHYVQREDAGLLSEVKATFAIDYRSLIDTPLDKNVIFTKINHGYWEKFLCVYAESFQARAQNGAFRGHKAESYRTAFSHSGQANALARAIARHLSAGSRDFMPRLALGFSNGSATYATIIKQAISPIYRGAYAGALAFFSSLDTSIPIALGDGAEPKSLLEGEKAKYFTEQLLSNSAAILFVVPPHLRKIHIHGATMPTYRMVIPGKWANETWRISLPIFLALVKRIRKKHGQITILVQGSTLAPLLALALAEWANHSESDGLIHFYDLGLVLDTAVPELVIKQAWFKRYALNPASTYYPFYLSEDAEVANVDD